MCSGKQMPLHEFVFKYMSLSSKSDCFISSGFQGIYDVEHFIETLKYDVKIVGKIPDVHKNGKAKKIKAFQVQALRDIWFSHKLEV